MPEADELALATRLMELLGGGAAGLEALSTGLNDAGPAPATGNGWSPETLAAELARLAVVPAKPPAARTLVAEYDAERAGARRRSTTPAAVDVEARTEFLLNNGLRNQWYLIAASAEIGDAPVGMQRCGERLVLWRDARGRVHAVEDRCPHRGAALSIGEATDDTIACAYHGVRVDAYGTVVSVPGLPGCPLEGKTLLRHYPIIEHYQAIWAWFGDELHQAPQPLELPEELVSPEWSGILHYDTWKGDYRYVIDNLCDPMHGPFLHGKTYTQSRGPRTDSVKVVETGHGFEVFREGQRGVNLDWMEFVLAGTSTYARVEIPMPPNAGPGGPMGIIFYTTPVDERHTRINPFRLRKVTGWQRDLWHFLFAMRIRGFVDAVLAQDIEALATMPLWPAQEHLYGHDAGLTRARKHFREAAKEQARAALLQSAS